MSGRKRRKLRSLFLWHRYLGLCAALFVVVLAISGGLLNHTSALRLDQRYVENTALMNWYHMQPTEEIIGEIVSYRLGARWVSQAGTGVYLDDVLLLDGVHLSGAVALDSEQVVAGDNQLLLLTQDGKLIERLTPLEGLPPQINAVGVDEDGGVLLRTAAGVYRPDESYSEWQHVEDVSARWSVPEQTPPALRQTLVQRYRGAGLNWERVVLDLHTGRILGEGGVYLMDVAALFMMGLALTGFWHWFKHQYRR
jgi:hypothetical protein